MALNPFFLQGSQSEQRLIQSIINEQLTIYGVEVTYIPRKFVNKDTVFNEIEASKFDDNFLLEAYVDTYEGYTGAGDIMTKFGVSLKDDLTITVSKERYEDFISPFLVGQVEVATRPSEGDLIYFPLGQRLFEVKFVEHEKPFYQLGKNYVYQLQCELFEYEDEVIDTSIEEIDQTIEDLGFMTTLTLAGLGVVATGTAATTGFGYVRSIVLNNDGYDYTKEPYVAISTSPTGDNATAVAITTEVGGVHSVKEILLTNPGSGYTTAPTVTIVSGATTSITGITTTHGVGAAATCGIVTNSSGVKFVGFSSAGAGYTKPTPITFSGPISGGIGTAIGQVLVATAATLGSTGIVTSVLISNAGIGYTVETPTITFTAPSTVTGVGTYQYNEFVTGSASSTTGYVRSWDLDSKELKVGNATGDFFKGENIVGSASSAKYTIVNIVGSNEQEDKYDQNELFETEGDKILDFSESNPFGQV